MHLNQRVQGVCSMFIRPLQLHYAEEGVYFILQKEAASD